MSQKMDATDLRILRELAQFHVAVSEEVIASQLAVAYLWYQRPWGTLHRRLQHLVAYGFVVRHVRSPTRVYYELTFRGRTFLEIPPEPIPSAVPPVPSWTN